MNLKGRGKSFGKAHTLLLRLVCFFMQILQFVSISRVPGCGMTDECHLLSNVLSLSTN